MQAWRFGQQKCSTHLYLLMTAGCADQQLERLDLLRVHSIYFPLNTVLGNGWANKELSKAIQRSL